MQYSFLNISPNCNPNSSIGYCLELELRIYSPSTRIIRNNLIGFMTFFTWLMSPVSKWDTNKRICPSQNTNSAMLKIHIDSFKQDNHSTFMFLILCISESEFPILLPLWYDHLCWNNFIIFIFLWWQRHGGKWYSTCFKDLESEYRKR